MRRILFFILAFVVALTPLYAENITEGTNAGGDLTTGDANIFFGEDSGRKTTTGWGNIFIGEGAGRSNTTGVRNIFLGYLAGNGVTGSNRFYLQTAPYSPTMVAHLDSQKVAINATNALGYSLYVNGTAKVSGAFTAGSTTADSLTSKRFFASIPGGAGNPVFAPSGDKDTGFYFYTATGNRIGVSAKGANVATFDSSGVAVTGGITSTGTATFQAFNTPVQAMLADSTLTASRSGWTYIVRGVAGKVTDTLPENPAVGTNFIFAVMDTDSLRIKCAGSDSLIDGTGAAWKTTTSVAGWIKVTLGLANKWFLTAYNGTWTSY
jgi:hypothetical protein